jgi:MoxR-like ATPase
MESHQETAYQLPPDDVAAIDELGKIYQSFREEIGKAIIGQEEVIEQLAICLFAKGHALLMGVPGLAKTLLVSSVAQTFDLTFNRIQFTPDLMPADITGTDIIQESGVGGKREFEFIKGPVFANIVLADEINRASPKTQSALLEAMQERCVTVLGKTHELPLPFFVLATQNPIELEGTYPLPEAQLDRFLFKLEITRNNVETLQRIVSQREIGTEPVVEPIMTGETLTSLLALVRRIHMPDVVANYIARLVDSTHPGQSDTAALIRFGASPRAALAMASAAKARALLHERMNASFEDVKAIAPSVLRHRIVLDYNARVDGHSPNSVVATLLKQVPFQDSPTPKTLVPA